VGPTSVRAPRSSGRRARRVPAEPAEHVVTDDPSGHGPGADGDARRGPGRAPRRCSGPCPGRRRNCRTRTCATAGRSGELAEHERAGTPGGVLTDHVLLGDEVHAVLQWRHEHRVGEPVVGQQPLARHPPVQVVHRDLATRAGEPAVHPTDDPFDVPPQLPVLRYGPAARDRDLGLGLGAKYRFRSRGALRVRT
jgi:hypothetical protein